MACGLATGFWSLFLARVGVGFGEAGGVAPAYSLVSDYFPRAQRARALALHDPVATPYDPDHYQGKIDDWLERYGPFLGAGSSAPAETSQGELAL